MNRFREGLIILIAVIAGLFIYACLHDLGGMVKP